MRDERRTRNMEAITVTRALNTAKAARMPTWCEKGCQRSVGGSEEGGRETHDPGSYSRNRSQAPSRTRLRLYTGSTGMPKSTTRPGGIHRRQ